MTPRQRTRSGRGGSTNLRAPKADAGGTLVGLFIGIAVGLSLAAAVAFYLMKAGNPYQSASPAKEPARESGRDPAKSAKVEPATADKPRFDFYKILPGNEEPKVQAKTAEKPAPDKATVERAITPDKGADKSMAKLDDRTPAGVAQPSKSSERFWLQAGSFAGASDAENLKARLALAGWEAEVQAATLSDKGVRYRVRLGPYDNTDELNRVKGELGKRGFEVAVIKY
jgi:cell division protein FtsN